MLDLPAPVIAAIITAICATVIAPLVYKYVFADRARLRVDLRFYKYGNSTAILEPIKEYQRAQTNTHSLNVLRCLSMASCYTQVAITNTSSKKVDDIFVEFLSPIAGVAQVEKGITFLLRDKERIGLGSVQPKQQITIHCWCSSVLYDRYYQPKDIIAVYANELHSVRFRYPIPRYISHRLFFKLPKYAIGTLLLVYVAMGMLSWFAR